MQEKNLVDEDGRLSLEASLQAYRVLHTPAQFSWKQYWVKETFSHDDLLSCTEEEKKKFLKRLEEGKVTVCDNIKHSSGKVCSLTEVLRIMTNPAYKNVKKLDRKVVYASDNGERPIGKKAFELWGGFQVIDMDIKDRKFAEEIKAQLFQRLKKYNWFLGISFSSSGKGLHVYTKISVSQNEQGDPLKKKLLFLSNFRHKYSFVYLACLNIIPNLKNEDGSEVTKEQLLKWMDLAMFKPQQGAFIGFDPSPLINTRFFEDFIYVNFDNAEDLGHPDVDWVSYPDLKETFRRWEWFEEEGKKMEVDIKSAGNPELQSIHRPMHYKHFERWRLANTLVKLYGLDNGYKYLRAICTSETTDKELQGDCTTAARHEKPIDAWAINRLNKCHGFDIKVSIDNEEKDVSELYKSIDTIQNPTLIKRSDNTMVFNISSKEYLGHIKDTLLENIGRITLIEAGAGVGKTEMMKSLVRDGKKVILVMPFTSTIKSKIEGDEGWHYAYGNKKVKLDAAQGIAMTIDKFSKLNLMEVKELGFDYIIIDESHLMFQSEYRPVMPKVIDMVRNTETPVIMMSGTPVGETVFFPDIVHLKVIKDDVRKKEFNVHLTDQPSDSLCYMCRMMAKDISEGRRVLFPTNKGTAFKESIEVLVKHFLENDFFIFNEPKVRYYKKSNIGEGFMDDVNFKKTVADTDILLCSTYLSVGVDILDKFDFNIYFNELWMPQEIEQFANRLRSHDLYINLFLNRKDSEGRSLNVCSYNHIDFNLNNDEVKDAHSILRLCNAMIERNPVEYKYNSLVASIIRNNKFIEYDDIENKYYLNEIAYKTIFFERKYRDYVQQLPVLVKGMISYGYKYNSEDLGEFHDESLGEGLVKDLVKGARMKAKQRDSQHTEELLQIMTEDRLDIYRDVLQGRYDITKGNDWNEDPFTKKMTVKNIEVFEKVVPLVVSMSKMYDVQDIRNIFEFCKEKNNYNFAAIRRIKLLSNIIYNSKLNRLDLPIEKYMKETYKFVEKNSKCKKYEIDEFVEKFTQKYAEKESKGEVNILLSPITLKSMAMALRNIFNCLVNVSRPDKKKEVKLSKTELLWEEKHEKRNNAVKNLFVIDDFLGNITVEESVVKAAESDVA